MLIAYYDLQTSPATYDIVAFLLAAERYRIRRGEDKVAIRVLPGPVNGFRKDKYWPFSIDGRQRMLDQVALPMARMLPSACEVSLWRGDRPKPIEHSIGYACRLYGLKLQIECLQEGIRPLRPPPGGPAFDERLVTITLREAEHWPERNSNVAEWIAAAQELSRRGYRVVVIRDSRLASQRIDGVTTDMAASLDLIARAQLYRAAACNMFVNNGPAWFALALDVPVLMLKPVTENLMRTCSADYFRHCGVAPGGQIPNAPDYQRIVWQEDRCENIVGAFDGFTAARRVAA